MFKYTIKFSQYLKKLSNKKQEKNEIGILLIKQFYLTFKFRIKTI
jgi:hypothetical protein